MTKAIDSSEKQSYQLVTFQYGDPASPLFARYTDWAQQVENFTSTPEMEIELPENHGTFQDSRLIITVPILDAFTARAARVLPHSRIFVRVDDVTRGTIMGESASILTFFRGKVVHRVKNKDGRPGMMAFECQARKSRLEVSLGIPATNHCAWALFGRGCELLKATFQRTVTITSAVGKTATINNATFTAPTSPGGNVDHYWERGTLERDGIVVSIRDWSITDPTAARCRRTIPPEWVGQTVIAAPGCHQTIEDCRDVWDNEEGTSGRGGFGGFGYGMQDYNPLYEDPQ